ncbi:MAG: DUF6011 domain-containing protein [Chloroflexota bacterium]|jgi:hypothetical protein
MEKQARCKKCGRRLKSPLSIAIGMGPKCAGIKPASARRVRVQSKPSSRTAYSDKTLVQMQAPLFTGELPKKGLSKRELFRRRREERRRLFETRLPFQCGLVLPARKQLAYTPMEDGSWREDYSGRVISHERLQQYLVRFRFI